MPVVERAAEMLAAVQEDVATAKDVASRADARLAAAHAAEMRIGVIRSQ